MTPLMYLLDKTGDFEVVPMFLAKHPALNVRDRHGETALGIADSHNQVENVKRLLKAGARW